MNVTIDAEAVRKVFTELPGASSRVLVDLFEGGAIDFQRDMRKRSPVHDGAYRNSIKYTIARRALTVTVGPRVNYAPWVEEGSRPHWVSIKRGSPLRKWAEDKGIPPRAVQLSIARKGTKGQYVVQKTFNFNHRAVRRDIETGFGRFIREVNNGRI